ncbi:hypothetical protein ACHHYP_05325 [Achlya hypogyna]|uniref:Secreted protein n=1 Tax=Achlya hypogyna TaxID=1202772 RepID=A0A0A7CMA5_ACHHY|nr:secreted protein [Achlya hypogyna]OQR90683.1 hypothetical protein ACHHYP_05325 [Achlya hypogyna]
MRAPLLSLCLLASTAAAASNATAAHNESGVIEDIFPSAQWGIRRVMIDDDQKHVIKLYDAYVSLWSGIVHTESWNGQGGKAWEIMASNAGKGYDMLRHVWDNQCLDAYLVPGDNYPRLHGYACDRNNENQRWYYTPSRSADGWTRICHKKYTSYCLGGNSYGGDAFMTSTSDYAAQFIFVP